MLLDTLLTIAHHLLAFGILGVLAAELALTVATPDLAWRNRLAKLDAVYGLMAVSLIAVGVGRLVWGAKGADYFLGNPYFWAKMAAFAGVGLVSIVPTLTILRWRKAAALPQPAELARLRRWIGYEAVLFVAIPVFAALMVRWGG